MKHITRKKLQGNLEVGNCTNCSHDLQTQIHNSKIQSIIHLLESMHEARKKELRRLVVRAKGCKNLPVLWDLWGHKKWRGWAEFVEIFCKNLTAACSLRADKSGNVHVQSCEQIIRWALFWSLRRSSVLREERTANKGEQYSIKERIRLW